MLPKDTSPARGRNRQSGYGLMDLFVVGACTLTFALTVYASRNATGDGPPLALIAQELGTTPQQLKRAADSALTPIQIGPPTEAQKRQVATTLNVSVERLDAVMEKYRPKGPLP